MAVSAAVVPYVRGGARSSCRLQVVSGGVSCLVGHDITVLRCMEKERSSLIRRFAFQQRGRRMRATLRRSSRCRAWKTLLIMASYSALLDASAFVWAVMKVRQLRFEARWCTGVSAQNWSSRGSLSKGRRFVLSGESGLQSYERVFPGAVAVRMGVVKCRG